MKIKWKCTLGSVAAFGVLSFSSCGVSPKFHSEATSTPSIIETKAIAERSGKVQLNFVDFYYGKGWVANFEMINDTTEPIIYVGNVAGKFKNGFDYCTLAVRHQEPIAENDSRMIENFGIKVMDQCYQGTYFGLQTLRAGEKVLFSVDEYRVREMLGSKDAKLDTIAQVGFEIFTGEDKRREILWTGEIRFPPDDYR